MGKRVGDQGLWGNSDQGADVKAYTGWYAPAMNTHRTAFDSRAGEYYSEDGLLAGMMAANASLGIKAKGGYVYIKHFALHEDGGGVTTYRGIFASGSNVENSRASGLSIWCNEQAMREVYFKPFQIAVENGKADAAMSSFSRIGKTWAGGSYAQIGRAHV